MSSIRILPHETVNLQFSDSIKLEEWFLGSRELNKIELGSFNEFDPTSISQFWRQIMIDPRNLASELLQGSAGRFCITIEVRSEHSKLRYVEAFEEFSATDAKFVLDYEVEIPNIELGGRLVLTTKLVLVKGDPKDPVAASRPGSILGSDIRNYEVEESFDGFPHLEPSNLTEIFGLTPGPNWLVDVDTDDLYVHCTQGLTVNLNADSKVGKLLLGGKAENEPLRLALRCDVHRAMVIAALDSSDFEAEIEKSVVPFKEFPNSIGAFLYGNLMLCGFWDGIRAARALREQAPVEFEARIQNLAFGG
jgi:hypothetical protein